MPRRETFRARSDRAPFEPAALGVARGAARAGLRRLHARHAVRTATTLASAVALARLAGSLIETGDLDRSAVGLAVVAAGVALAWPSRREAAPEPGAVRDPEG